MMKIKTKKADGFTTTELLVVVLVLATIGLIIYGAYNFYSDAKKKAALVPGDVEIVGQFCTGTGASTPQYFCSQFNRVNNNGKDQRVTCQYLKTKNLYPNLPTVDCSSFNIPLAANETCDNNKLAKGYLLNGVSCEDWSKALGAANAVPSCKPKFNTAAEECTTKVRADCLEVNDQCSWVVTTSQCELYEDCSTYSSSEDCNSDGLSLCVWK